MGIAIIVMLSGCKGSRRNIEEALSDITAPHPTENLTDFYELEGIRDEHFSEEDKGVWMVSTSLAYFDEEQRYMSEGMRIWINRNTESAEGNYFINEFSSTGRFVEEQTYAVQLLNDEIQLLDEADKEVQSRIENFQFGVQYLNLQPDYLKGLETTDVSYTSNVPLYSISYKLEKEDNNIKSILSQYNDYDIPIEGNPILSLSGSGEMEGPRTGRRDIDILLNETERTRFRSLAIYFPDSER